MRVLGTVEIGTEVFDTDWEIGTEVFDTDLWGVG